MTVRGLMASDLPPPPPHPPQGTVYYQDSTEVNATFHNFITPGSYELYLENPGNCRTPNAIPITVPEPAILLAASAYLLPVRSLAKEL